MGSVNVKFGLKKHLLVWMLIQSGYVAFADEHPHARLDIEVEKVSLDDGKSSKTCSGVLGSLFDNLRPEESILPPGSSRKLVNKILAHRRNELRQHEVTYKGELSIRNEYYEKVQAIVAGNPVEYYQIKKPAQLRDDLLEFAKDFRKLLKSFQASDEVVGHVSILKVFIEALEMMSLRKFEKQLQGYFSVISTTENFRLVDLLESMSLQYAIVHGFISGLPGTTNKNIAWYVRVFQKVGFSPSTIDFWKKRTEHVYGNGIVKITVGLPIMLLQATAISGISFWMMNKYGGNAKEQIQELEKKKAEITYNSQKKEIRRLITLIVEANAHFSSHVENLDTNYASNDDYKTLWKEASGIYLDIAKEFAKLTSATDRLHMDAPTKLVIDRFVKKVSSYSPLVHRHKMLVSFEQTSDLLGSRLAHRVLSNALIYGKPLSKDEMKFFTEETESYRELIRAFLFESAFIADAFMASLAEEP